MSASALPSPSPYSLTGSRSSSYDRVSPGEHEFDVEEQPAHGLTSGSPPSFDTDCMNDLQNFSIDDDDDGDDKTEPSFHRRGHNLVQQFVDDDIDDGSSDHTAPSHSTISTAERAPSHYICPLTLQLMEDPVNDGCGHCFERKAILDWLQYGELCPISRKPLQSDGLFHNGRLKSLIFQWKEDHPHYLQTHNTYSAAADDVLGLPDHNSHSQFELMLLPQERQVLKMIKARAKSRQKRRERSRCLCNLGIATLISIVVVTILAIKFLNVGQFGPI